MGYHHLPMSVWERFPRAPIAEAVLDINVRFSAPVELRRLEAFHEGIHDPYPVKQSRIRWEGQIELAHERVAQEVRQGAQGFMFRSADDTRVVQVRQDGFTFNWLKRYDSWEVLREEACRHWDRYRETFHPRASFESDVVT